MFIFLLLVSQNGTDYGFLVRQNSELLRGLNELEKTCATLREENGLLVRLQNVEQPCVLVSKVGQILYVRTTQISSELI